MPETRFRTCNLCEAMCGLAITVDEERITNIRGDAEDPFSRGHICPKGPALGEVYADPDRLRRPMRRTAGGWQEVSWKEALDEAGERLSEIRARHGRDSVGTYIGNPSVHNHGASMMVYGFLKALGSKNRFDANSQDANPKLFACLQMYGDLFGITLPDVDRTDYLLMLGANPAASNGSLMTLGDVKGRLAGVRERGGKIVLIDPRRSESAAWSSEHHFIRPGGDALFLLALLQVLFADGLVNDAQVAELARGGAELRQIVAPYPPERVAAAIGIEAATIRRIAGEFARAKAAVAYGRVGTCQNEFGSVASWLMEALNVVTGNFDRAGGAMFASPAVDLASLGRKIVGSGYARWKSRVRGLPEMGGQLPAAVMIEEMETPGEGQIRGFVNLAGNPVLSTANGGRLSAALAKLDYMVAIDYYINETNRHAHLILPPLHALERSHYDVVFHALAVRNTAKYSGPVVTPDPGGREDWWILYELGMRLGGLRFGLGPLDSLAKLGWRAGLRLTPDRLIDLALRSGRYGDKFNPFGKGLSLKKLERQPHGVDLGPLVPRRAEVLRTPDGKVDLAPPLLVNDLPRVDRWLEAPPQLVLIGRRHVRSNNSWMHNCRSLVKGPDRSSLLMHPSDAAERGLGDGQSVRVTSRVGSVTARLERSDSVMPGVVSLPHGFGHADVKDTMKVAGATAGQSANALTDEQRLDPLTGTAALNGVPVTVVAA
jgi:anaerobic selenocysteine-containing dehydrogenase